MKKQVLLLFLVLTPVVSATDISSEEVTVDLEDSSVDVTVEVSELTASNFTYLTSYPISNLEAEIDGETADCEVENLQIGSEISCEVEKTQNFSVEMDFRGSGFVRSQQGVRIFQYSQPFYRPTSSYSMQVLLPRGSGIVDSTNISTPVISPGNGEVGSNGRRISVTWNTEPELGQTSDYQVAYERYSISGGQEYLWIILGVIIFGIASYFGSRWLMREDIETVYEDLEEDEIEVVEMIRENDGSMLQKDIVEKSDYSKAKISSLVSSLADKEVVKKQKEGRSNAVSIRKKYRA